MSTQRLFEFGDHVLDTRDGLDLPHVQAGSAGQADAGSIHQEW